MIVFVNATTDCQPMLLVLEISPEQVVQRPQRIDLELSQRVESRAADILEPLADRIHGLNEHSLFVPVRPDQLEEARVGQLPAKDARADVYPIAIPLRLDDRDVF